MKLYISVDIEGVAGVVNWDQVMPGSQDYEIGRRLLLEEVNSLVRGAVIAGAESIVVNDAHGPMRNLVPDLIDDHATLISGHLKPMYMMEGLDASFDAVVFLGYHGPAGSSSVLSHTYNPRVIWEARINGAVTGETGINALVAHHYGVPVILITGDDVTISDARIWVPEAKSIVVKNSISRFSARSISPKQAGALIFDKIQAVLDHIPTVVPSPDGPIYLDLIFQSEDMAALAEWAGAIRMGQRKVRIESRDGVGLYRQFHAILLLARAAVDA